MNVILTLFRSVVQDKIANLVSEESSEITFLIEYSEDPQLTEVKFFWNGEKSTEDLLKDIKSEQSISSNLAYENGQNSLIISL